MPALVIVPTYNECDNVLPLLRRVHELHPEIHVLIVDDASPDGTADLVRAHMKGDHRVHLVTRSAKLGLGTAYVAGFAYGLKHGYGTLIQMDCDFSHPPESLADLLKLSGDNDLVVGSRYVEGGSIAEWNWYRRCVSLMANRFAARVLGVGVRDLTAGFNAYSAGALSRIAYDDVASKGYAFQIETKYRVCRAGLRWTETPIKFVDRRHGASKIPRAQALFTFLRVIQLRLMPPPVRRED